MSPETQQIMIYAVLMVFATFVVVWLTPRGKKIESFLHLFGSLAYIFLIGFAVLLAFTIFLSQSSPYIFVGSSAAAAIVFITVYLGWTLSSGKILAVSVNSCGPEGWVKKDKNRGDFFTSFYMWLVLAGVYLSLLFMLFR